MKILKLSVLGIIGFTGFVFLMVNVIGMFEAFKTGASDDIEGKTILFALVGFIVTGISAGFFEHVRTSTDDKKEKVVKEKNVEEDKKSLGGRVDEGKILGGVFLMGLAIYEFSTGYFSDILVSNQDTELLRRVFSSGLIPIVVGLWGLKNAYFGIKPFLDKKVIDYMDKNDL